MELNPTGIRPAATVQPLAAGQASRPATSSNLGREHDSLGARNPPVRVRVEALSLVGFAPREQAEVIDGFQNELALLMEARRADSRAGTESLGRLTVQETRPNAIGRAAARELARRLLK